MCEEVQAGRIKSVNWRNVLRIGEHSSIDECNDQFCKMLFNVQRIDLDLQSSERCNGENIFHANTTIQAFLTALYSCLYVLRAKFLEKPQPPTN